ncbi:MAG: hypothetical protein ACR2GF_04635, partial [Acidimicrobiales bacterium]
MGYGGELGPLAGEVGQRDAKPPGQLLAIPAAGGQAVGGDHGDIGTLALHQLGVLQREGELAASRQDGGVGREGREDIGGVVVGERRLPVRGDRPVDHDRRGEEHDGQCAQHECVHGDRARRRWPAPGSFAPPATILACRP